MAEAHSLALPVLPVKNTVLFPYLLMPMVVVGRPASVAAVDAALASEGKELLVFTQRNAKVEEPGQDDLFAIGTRAIIKKLARPEPGLLEVALLGVERVRIAGVEQAEPYMKARVTPLPLPQETSTEVEALHRAVAELAAKVMALVQPDAPVDWSKVVAGADDPLRLVYLLASIMSLELDREQALLEAETRADALRLMHAYLSHELQVLELRNKIANQAQSEIRKEQRDYVLRQQMQAIRQELGEESPEQAEVKLLRERLAKTALPEEARREAERELARLERLPSGAPDYHVTRTWLEFVLELPWTAASEDSLDLARARQVLDEDHYALKDVKERILEHLGVRKLNPGARGPILCFVGAPGTGKTSVGQSIARAMGRRFERMSLGGLHDEAELRGHRRTYIGAMPGRVLQAVRRAGVKNPVLMLDEVDKLGRDFRGDPAAALLEILDPEQNRAFRDNYLDLAFDLSGVFFITTANTLEPIPRPLLDRMEVLHLSGYTEEEKLEIAKRYQVPRQLRETGLASDSIAISDPALLRIIKRYTREAGVRQLERTIGRAARKIALRRAEGDLAPVTITPEQLPDLLGPEMFFLEEARRTLPAGVAAGLAWTETGGDVLYVEATLLGAGRGLTLTGHLGEVMQESARAAQSYLWSHAAELGIDAAQFRRNGVHLHVPSGAVPKDGPSAGVTMACALASLYAALPARPDTAMTGEITLTGLVLPVGGIKEKVLAARRAGLQRVILPRENQKDLRDLPPAAREALEFVFVERVEEALAAAIPALTPLVQSLA
jgi:ATP-dependent Lon protease